MYVVVLLLLLFLFLYLLFQLSIAKVVVVVVVPTIIEDLRDERLQKQPFNPLFFRPKIAIIAGKLHRTG